MIIRSMTATFGKLQGETMTLAPGMNIINAPNEGGKSTWCAFLRAMFYGFMPRQSGIVAEKNRYLPWSGGTLSGVIELEWKGQEITLRRFPKGTAPFGGFQAVYTGTEEPVPFLTADTVGETLLGVSRDVFERTAFVGQGAIALTAAPDLESRIAALASAGQEDVSYSETERRLKDWRNQRRSNKTTGEIPKREGQLAQIEKQMEQLDNARSRAEAARIELEELCRTQASIEEDLRRHKAVEDGQRAAQSRQAQARLDLAVQGEAMLRQELAVMGKVPTTPQLRDAQGQLGYLTTLQGAITEKKQELAIARQAAEDGRRASVDPLFTGLTGEEAIVQGTADAAALLAAPGVRFAPWAPLFTALLLAVSLLVVGLVTRSIHMAILMGGGGGLVVLGGLVSLFLSRRAKGQGAKEKEALLEHYGVSCGEDILALAKAYAARCATAISLEREAEGVAGALETLVGHQETILTQVGEFVADFAPQATTPVALSAAITRVLTLLDKLERAQRDTTAAQQVCQGLAPDGAPPAPEANSALPPQRSIEEDTAALQQINTRITAARAVRSEAQGEQNTLGDAALLAAQRDTMVEELTRLEREHQALELALAVLADANVKLQTRFSPLLNAKAGEIMAALTGGAYDTTALSRDFRVLATPVGQVQPREVALLSQGTADQLYLAFRLAICQLALPQNEAPPLVLDDALVSFDDTRMALALDYLHTLAQERQLLVFTCQAREGAAPCTPQKNGL